jgi:Icc-related predicted phosphoesterase
VIRVAAVGDVHIGGEGAGRLAEHFASVDDHADLLLLAGDLTRCGEPSEARSLAAVLDGLHVPVVAVLGNHDHHAGQAEAVSGALSDVGVHVLEGTSVELDVDGTTVGVAGTKGFGGGFTGASGSEFGEAAMKAFARHSREVADGLGAALDELSADVRLALTHYSPVRDTLRGEPSELYPFLGSYLLAEVIDAAAVDAAFHGHAHRGQERGVTDGGVAVRNVAEPVIGAPFRVYGIGIRSTGLHEEGRAMTDPEPRTVDQDHHDDHDDHEPIGGTGGSSDDDEQPDDTGATGTLGDRSSAAADRPV